MKKKKYYDGPLINIDPRLVMGTREAGRILGVCEREVRYKIQRKKLPALKIGNRYYIHAHAPRVYLNVQKLLRPRWSANRAERLRRCATDQIISCASHTLNPTSGPVHENLFSLDYSCLSREFNRENIETRPYMRSLPQVPFFYY